MEEKVGNTKRTRVLLLISGLCISGAGRKQILLLPDMKENYLEETKETY